MALDQSALFSEEQWHFLATLKAFDQPVPVSLAGQLAPLMPGPLFDLINKCRELGWLEKDDNDWFALTAALPQGVLKNLEEINTPVRLTEMAGKIRSIKGQHSYVPEIIIPLMEKGGLLKEASLMDIDMANRAMYEENPEAAWIHLKRTADRFLGSTSDEEAKTAFVRSVLDLSSLTFALGKGMADLSEYLHQAHAVAKDLGDARSHAMINMHLGCLYYFSDRRELALVALSTGLTEIEELGDADILDQSAAFLGLFYFMQGMFREALEHLERAERIFDGRKRGQIRNPLTPILHGYCLTYIGEFHRAIGCLDFHWRSAKERSNHTLAVTLRVILGTVLMLIKREKEGHFHIDEAVREASERKNAFALYLAAGAIAMRYMRAGKIEKAYETILKNVETGAASGLVRQYASPWVLEMIYEFERREFPIIPEMSFSEAMARAIEENNVHLHGVSLRLRSQKRAKENADYSVIQKDLEKSLEYLDKSGDIRQQAKTGFELSRLALSQKNREQARHYAKTAWKVLGGYAEDFFPDDLRFLLDTKKISERLPETASESLDRYIELTESMFPVHSQQEILAKAIVATNRFFGAERGGLFWFPGGRMTQTPELRAACNLSVNDVNAENFKNNLQAVLKTFSTSRPVLQRGGGTFGGTEGRAVKSLLCLPVEINGRTRAVIYHDNSYLEDCFDFLDQETIEKVVAHISRQVARLYEFLRLKQEHSGLVYEKILHEPRAGDRGIIFESTVMQDLLDQVDKAALSDSTILLLGETGVGKELIARRIHAKSHKRGHPFIVVDSTAMPEGLVESELFGHEKGAFTGAEGQKKGRLELADKGTLFIDEIGELPGSMQVKLLRAIQERSFCRVGGTRELQSDFRLIVATNRDLAAEVDAGRFRRDLYYRLNVVPFQIPALRDRKDDILVLAKHFLVKFARKFSRQGLILEPETESILKNYHWPGNIRELENVMERAVLLSLEGRLKIELSTESLQHSKHPFSGRPTLEELEKQYIQYIINETGGRIGGAGGASEILGLKRTTLYARMKKLGLK